MDNQKLDIIDKLDNIFIKEGCSTKQLSLIFKPDSLNARGIYRFSCEFLEMAFQVRKFSTYCIDNNLEELLIETTRKLCQLNPHNKYQFRLIQEDDNQLIRGITSVRYNNYDNHLALYLTLLALHRHVQTTHQWYALE